MHTHTANQKPLRGLNYEIRGMEPRGCPLDREDSGEVPKNPSFTSNPWRYARARLGRRFREVAQS